MRPAVCGASAISGTSTIAGAPAVERRRDRVEVDLGLARAGDAVDEQRPALAGREQRVDARDGDGLLLGRQRCAVARRRPAARSGARRARSCPSAAICRSSGCEMPAASRSSAARRGPSASASSTRCRAARSGSGLRHGLEPRLARRRDLRRQHERQRARGRRAVVRRDPERQLDEVGRNAGAPGRLDRPQALGLGLPRADDDRIDDTRAERRPHDRADRKRLRARRARGSRARRARAS